MTNLGRITEELAIESARADLDAIDITHITDDSRRVTPGALFVARPGTANAAATFIPAAIAAGAIAILTDPSVTPDTHPALASGNVALLHTHDLPATVAHLAERFHAHPAKDLTLIGITGTNGKTTIAHILKHALDTLGLPAGVIGSVTIDDGATQTKATLTTPFAIDISNALARMRDNGCRAAILEVSSHALDQGRVAALEFDIAIFTNLTGDHLDYHKTTEAYAQAKASLFTNLRPGAAAIVNTDDPAHARITRDCPVPITHCSRTPESEPHYTITPTNLSLHGITAEVHTPDAHFPVAAPLVGEHNLMNLLQAVAVLDRLGFMPDQIKSALQTTNAPPGRLESVQPPGVETPFTVLIDYAHTDDALDNVLRALRPFTPNHLRLVFGCGGDRDKAKRPRMAAVAANHADHIILTSDNPRTEDPDAIIRDVLAGFPPDTQPHLTIEPDRAKAIQAAINAAQPGDTLLIAGKGHEDYQLLPDGNGGIVRRDFDDKLIAAQAIANTQTPQPANADTSATP